MELSNTKASSVLCAWLAMVLHIQLLPSQQAPTPT